LRGRGVQELREFLAEVSGRGQQDLVEVGWFDLVLGKGGYRVSNTRMIKVKSNGAEGDQGEVVAHR
jgi:hypothetical protein